jgi:hypothetical protein
MLQERSSWVGVPTTLGGVVGSGWAVPVMERPRPPPDRRPPEGRRRHMNAYGGGVPVEKTSLPVVSGVGAGLLLARRNVLERV